MTQRRARRPDQVAEFNAAFEEFARQNDAARAVLEEQREKERKGRLQEARKSRKKGGRPQQRLRNERVYQMVLEAISEGRSIKAERSVMPGPGRPTLRELRNAFVYVAWRIRLGNDLGNGHRGIYGGPRLRVMSSSAIRGIFNRQRRPEDLRRMTPRLKQIRDAFVRDPKRPPRR